MGFPSITTIVTGIFLAYMGHSMWLMAQLFTTLKCTGVPCYTSLLGTKPQLQLALFTSVTQNPIASETTKVYSEKDFDYWHDFEQEIELDIPLKTRRNGTLFMQVVLAQAGETVEWRTLRRNGPTVILTTNLTEHVEPQAQAFQLLGQNRENYAKDAASDMHNTKGNTAGARAAVRTVTHLRPNVHVSILTDNISVSQSDVPPEMGDLIRVNAKKEILPILKTDFFNTHVKDLVQVTKNTTEFKIKFHYRPMSIGKLRLMLIIEQAMKMIETMGFPKSEVDEVKSMFSVTNVYLLCGTVLITTLHILFDFLSFKNDVIFWHRKRSYEGLSTRTTLWRAFSQIVIFLYLFNENTSLLVLVPAGVGVLIDLWKCKKILKINLRPAAAAGAADSAQWKAIGSAERKTEEFDKQGMRYLSYMLYPLCILGAIYSLLYQPHKSWYSWTLHSLVNGVYAFGFLLMLPQLFVNYKLKSVAALPWRAFMYKAFNTFIDDFFAFIITMPTAHRVACLRDDVIFLIYLYQRWLYPVDKSRLDTAAAIDTDEHRHEHRD